MTGTARLAHRITGGSALLVIAASAACTSDGDDSPQAAPTSTPVSAGAAGTPAAPTSAADSGDVDAFCGAVVDLEASFSVGLGTADRVAPPEARATALTEWNATVRRQLHDTQDNAPPEVADDVDALVDLIHEGLTFGSFTPDQEVELAEIDDALDTYQLAECGFGRMEATGVDYAYVGLPAAVPAGVVAITFTNQGAEKHEILLARLDGAPMAFDQVLTLPADQAYSMIAPVGHSTALPGESETTFVRLEPGRYGVGCVVPQGTTHHAEGSGPPHHALGMVAEFSVG